MSLTVLRTAGAWWLGTPSGAARIDTDATTTGELLARVALPERVMVPGFGAEPGSVVTVAEFGGPILHWDSRLEHAVTFACRIAGRDFTEAEWATHFGDRPFRTTCPGAPIT